MACFKPLHGYWGHSLTANGKRRVVFNKADAFVDKPMDVPCGQCIGCRIDKSKAWATRCMHEASQHQANSFVTFTYSPENLPADGSLNHRHFQLFMKRLRKKYGQITIRFYMCGEYGDQNGRPHYHAILFGIDFADKRKHSGKDDKILYVSDDLDSIWGLGHCFIGSVTNESAGYVARYVLKKVNGERADEHYRRINPETGEVYWLQPEYACMSRRGGIGTTWFKKYASDLYPSDFAVVKGKKQQVPRFYDKLLEKENPELHKTIKRKRIARANKPKAKANSTQQRLNVRAECLEAKTSLKKRNI